jgi:2-(1,2-epoxy-1,2-dihydrophenyl)acetyl-CoA isomerase
VEQQTVVFEKKGNVAVISLNRPEKLNAQTSRMAQQLLETLRGAEADPEVRVVVLRGEGRAFCSGHDLTEPTGRDSLEKELADVEVLQKITGTIMGMGKPVIAAIHGYALGAGCEWAINCDMIIAAEGTKIGFPETRLGSAVGNGATKLLPLLIGLARAKEMILTNRIIDADEAERWGLVNKVVPPDILLDEAVAVAGKMAESPALANRLAKLAINRALHLDMEQTLQTELKDMILTDTISRR